MSDPLPMTVAEAIAVEQAGRLLRFLFFWGHKPARDGGIGSGCLSQVAGLLRPGRSHLRLR
ncbi:hypothetical protein [Streptosporangium soli]